MVAVGRAHEDVATRYPVRTTGSAAVVSGEVGRPAVALRARPAGWSGRWWPSTAQTRIISWVLLLVLLALAVVTLLTWRLLVQATDQRMDAALRVEIQEFAALTASGIDPASGLPFAGLDEVLETAITYNLARPNEKFIGYVDGVFAYQSRVQAPVVLAQDPGFAAVVDPAPVEGRYASEAGEVRYVAVPVRLAGDPRRGVIVAAYFADQEREAADDAAGLMLAVGALTVLLAAAGAWVVAGRVLQPVRDVVATARAITDTDLSRRIPVEERGPGDRDELRELARTVNAMLDRVEAGVAVQRRFVDDAGHELRTPITIIRGHLEVLDPDDPDDVRDALAVADDELERMNRLVSDLLLLATSEQPQFLRTTAVDVAALTADVLNRIAGLGDRAWELETAARVHAVLDPQRIVQALVALADNAVHHTGPGDRIAIGSRLTGGHLGFWVTDSGPGVPEADRARIFERFARAGDAARSDGAGLGLSIVRAIAVAHGGRVELDSPPGRGATFTLVVPVTRPVRADPAGGPP